MSSLMNCIVNNLEDLINFVCLICVVLVVSTIMNCFLSRCLVTGLSEMCMCVRESVCVGGIRRGGGGGWLYGRMDGYTQHILRPVQMYTL